MPLTIHYYHIQILEKKNLKWLSFFLANEWHYSYISFFFQVLAGDECANHDEETASSPDTNQSLKTSTCLPATPPGSTDLHQPLQNNKLPPQICTSRLTFPIAFWNQLHNNSRSTINILTPSLHFPHQLHLSHSTISLLTQSLYFSH